MENRRGPRTLPWGIPASIGNVVVVACRYLTMNCLLVKYDLSMMSVNYDSKLLICSDCFSINFSGLEKLSEF